LAQHLFTFEEHPKIHIIQYTSRFKIPALIRQYKAADTIFYSDDHYGGFLADAGVQYVHTYHGNWPDARWLNIEYFLKSFYFIPKYAKTIKFAAKVVNVSNYMKKFTDRYNQNSITIRNGVDNSKIEIIHKNKNSIPNKCLMLGNVDSRKYGMLPKLIDALIEANIAINIDVYGRIVNKKIVRKLKKYKEVTLHGFVPFSEIDLSQYAFLLSTSTKENLPISIVEILKSNLPVVAFDVGGISEVIDNTSGRLLDIKNMEKSIEIIRLMLNNEISFTFNNFVLNDFDWNISARKYLKIFETVLYPKDNFMKD
jgi:glycosyltransferase involved in cell wall biosynthesis